MADKEVSNKKGGRKRREEEQIKNYSDVKKMKLDIDESNTWSRVKEIKHKENEVELNALAMSKEVETKQQEVELKILS